MKAVHQHSKHSKLKFNLVDHEDSIIQNRNEGVNTNGRISSDVNNIDLQQEAPGTEDDGNINLPSKSDCAKRAICHHCGYFTDDNNHLDHHPWYHHFLE